MWTRRFASVRQTALPIRCGKVIEYLVSRLSGPARAMILIGAVVASVLCGCRGTGSLKGEGGRPRGSNVKRRARASQGPTGPERVALGVDPERLNRAMALGAGYAVRECDEEGRFTYRINLDPSIAPPLRKYSIIRHVGAICALALYAQHHPGADVRAALARSVRYLKETSCAPLPGRDDLLAVWSYPEVVGPGRPAQAQLGGSGLGLAALAAVEKVIPGTTSLEELRRLAKFVLFLQKADGGFYPRYVPSEGGKSERRPVLYYPGEAALGLLMLYELDPDPRWLQAAADAVAHLARQRAGKPTVPHDHWALMATALLLPAYDRCKQPLPREAIIQHAVQICESILSGAGRYPSYAIEYGCLTLNGTTCGTAARLEGLLDALTYLPPERKVLRERVAAACTHGIMFLLRCQRTEGKYAGAIPHAARPVAEGAPRWQKVLGFKATEVRIDYVQHALSAMLRYEQMFFARQGE